MQDTSFHKVIDQVNAFIQKIKDLQKEPKLAHDVAFLKAFSEVVSQLDQITSTTEGVDDFEVQNTSKIIHGIFTQKLKIKHKAMEPTSMIEASRQCEKGDSKLLEYIAEAYKHNTAATTCLIHELELLVSQKDGTAG